MSYDVIVVGAGVYGASVAWALSKAGVKTLIIEQNTAAGDRGSSHGHTRLTRMTFPEGDRYVCIGERALKLWIQLEQQSDIRLFWNTGTIDAGPLDGRRVSEAIRVCRANNIPFRLLTAADLKARYPALRWPEEIGAILQDAGGLLHAEGCVSMLLQHATAAGATLFERTRCEAYQSLADRITVTTSQGQYSCGSLVFAGGPWTPKFFPFLQSKLTVTRQMMSWFNVPEGTSPFDCTSFPLMNVDSAHNGIGHYSTFPHVPGGPGIKIIRHGHWGQAVDPDFIDREPGARDFEAVSRFVSAFLPAFDRPPDKISFCMFTSTVDEHFLIDHPPGESNVKIISACSGHGFKFAPAIGEAVAEWITSGSKPDTLRPFSFT